MGKTFGCFGEIVNLNILLKSGGEGDGKDLFHMILSKILVINVVYA